MKVLLTGANGYIGTRLLELLSEKGHQVVALVRVPESVHIPERIRHQVTLIQGDLQDEVSFPQDIEAAYYLVHSMCHHFDDFDQKDRIAANHFLEALEKTSCQQILYLTGLITSQHLSKHLASRLEVEKLLKMSSIPVTVFRAGIIIGSGSASFEIIRDLVEKLPLMVAPKWVAAKCQPIAIRDVLYYLIEALGHSACIGKTFDIGGPDVLTYKEMLLGFAKVRNLRRFILVVPFLTPRLSSLWLIFVTATNYYLARTLVDSMTLDAICQENRIQKILPRKTLSYREAIERAFTLIQENAVISSWRDSWTASGLNPRYYEAVKVPEHGCYKMETFLPFSLDPDAVFQEVYNIGGKRGYFSMNWAWRLRGLIDRYIGGVGLRRGRTGRKELKVGDVIDFWRVVQVDTTHRRLILFAEMKVPGEAWLEFDVQANRIIQIATFRPKGVLGRLYWWLFWPIHLILFPGMLRSILKRAKNAPPKK